MSTIHSFRDVVEYGAHRGDEEEGKHKVSRRLIEPITVTHGQHEPIISEFVDIGLGGSLTIEGMGAFIVERRSDDAFIFCTSDFFSEDLFARWHAAEGLDACYEITDVHGFVRAISRAIATSAVYVGTHQVRYRDEHIDYKTPAAGVAPAITKFKRYAWQQEARSIWAPRYPTPPLRPWVIEVPAAVPFCRRVALYENGAVKMLVEGRWSTW